MVIGLDFDNTIASYKSLFQEVCLDIDLIDETWNGTKKELRELIRQTPNGEKTWMRIQGKVYGEFMHRADLIYGVAIFLIKCKTRNIPVYIVSHKTEYGHFDEKKIPLREEALNWMDKKNLFNKEYSPINKEDVFFTSSREEKVEKIDKLGCTYFIDDLIEVFEEPKFPKDVDKILFSSDKENQKNGLKVFDNWTDINEFILDGYSNKDLISFANLLGIRNPKSVTPVEGRGNSQVYKVRTSNKEYAMKLYPDTSLDSRPRLETEFRALEFLQSKGVKNIPKPEAKNLILNAGLYSWIDGNKISNISLKEILECVSFVKKLKDIKTLDSHDLNYASEACLSGKTLINQINMRLEKLDLVSKSEPALEEFLNKFFSPLLGQIKKEFLPLWPLNSLDKDLEKKYLIPSPSDFGIHNTIRDQENNIIFIDFDYFGWDDPVKLASDFYWHPAMNLKIEHREFWLCSLKDMFKDTDSFFENRLNAAMPLYALRWILIILNEFILKDQKRRQHAKSTQEYNWEQIKHFQLNKAIDLTSSLKKYIT